MAQVSDIIRTVRRFGEYYTRAEPFRESDPHGWDFRVAAGERVKAAVRMRGRRGNVVALRRKVR